MSSIYRAMDTSKQNIYQRMTRQMEQMELKQELLRIIYEVREDHPGMGAKALYTKLKPDMGRDAFYIWYKMEGLTIEPKKNWRRTTDSSGVIRFDNLTIGLELTGVNQLWVSDITYYEIADTFYYLTFIMDQFSRKIKGYSASQSLRTEETTIPALLMGMKCLQQPTKTIFHSDGGGQYYSRQFLKLTADRFVNSMGKSAYENPFAERLNRTIKNNYLKYYDPKTFNQLKTLTSKAVLMYNDEKPHDGLYGLTPTEFEMRLLNQSVN
jgi:transposase InsO family protein